MDLKEQITTKLKTQGFVMKKYCNEGYALFPVDFTPDPKRLDAPCEVCGTITCQYNMRDTTTEREDILNEEEPLSDDELLDILENMY